MRLIQLVFLGALVVASVSACKQTGVVPTPTQVTTTATAGTKLITFDKDVKPIFLAKCGPCHLENGDRVNKWNNYTTVKTYITGIMGRVTRDITDPLLMPQNGPKLSDTEISTLRKWVDDGVLEK